MNGDEHLEGGITLDEAVRHAELFVGAGADAIDVSSGPPETSHWQFITMYQPYGALVPSAAAIKKAVKAPVIVVGKIDARHGERILREGSADFIQMARALMADPELPNKAREGRLDEIRPCIYCGWCQAGGTAGALANCTVNPALGRELEYKVEPAARRKKVMVVGGGPAGMEAARILAERGHETSLYEKSDRLGGQWNLVAAHIPEEGNLVANLATGLTRAGVKVFLNQNVSAQLVRARKPDAVVVATGSRSTDLDVPGANGRNVVQATDVLAGKASVGQDVAIVGGRTVGLETALFLAERGKTVSVVTRSKIANGVMPNKKAALFEYLLKYKVRLYPDCVVESITDKGINLWWSAGEPRDRVFSFLPADTVVLAVGSKKEDGLVSQLAGVAPEVYPIGDCAGKQSIFAAMRGGVEVGRTI
jgi:NADPH-dependent 2,4-dienoyl-CoA reductase/sulfur reductase-like enzyme